MPDKPTNALLLSWVKDASLIAPDEMPVATDDPFLVDLGEYRVLAFSNGIPPAFTTHPLSQTINEGLTVTFTWAATNADSFRLQKQESGSGAWENVPGATSSPWTSGVLSTASDNTDVYRVVATGPGGTANSNSATLTVVTPNPLLTNLALWYDFEEASGSRYDSDGGVPAHLASGMSLSRAAGKQGYGTTNPGDPAYNTYLRVPDYDLFNVSSTDSWTISGWVKQGDYASNNAVYSVILKATGITSGFYLYTVGQSWVFRTIQGGVNNNLSHTHSPSASVGDWVHFLIQNDGATGIKSIRTNNGSADSATHTWSAGSNGYLSFAGAVGIDSFGFWNRLLTSDERAALYAAGAGVSGTDIGLTIPSAPTVTKKVVCDGNSLTEGNSATLGLDDYPTRLRDLLGRDWSIVNIGIGGQTTSAMQSSAADATAAYDGAKSRNVCVCWEITNSIFYGVDAATIQAQLQSYVSARISEGYEVYTLTCLPRGTGGFTGPQEAIRLAVNAHLLANQSLYGGSGHVVDVAAISQLTNANDTTYYADGVHLTPRGYYKIAQAVAAVVGA